MPRTYRTEFTDFDYDIPELPGFRDESWHNDVCPKFVSHDDKLTIWIDYKDPGLREEGGHSDDGYQFTICSREDSPNPILYQSNDWDSMLSMLRLIQLALVTEELRNSKPTAPMGSHRIVEIV